MFIYSSVEWLLYCFHILAIVNNAVMSIRLPISFQISAFGFFRYILTMELLGNIVVLPLFFMRNSILFSIVAVPDYNSPNSVLRFPFVDILAKTCYL